MRIALDTNILAYAEGIDDLERKQIAIGLIGKLDEANTCLPVQVLGELFKVLRKARYSAAQARNSILRWADTFPLVETSSSVLTNGMDLAVKHDLSIWDAIILAAAAEAHCGLLLSEDLQDGFGWSGVTVVNPFSTRKNALLKDLFN